MLLLENPKSDSPMYPYSSGAPANATSVVAADTDATTAMLLTNQPPSAQAAMLYTPQGYVAAQKPSNGGFLSANGGASATGVPTNPNINNGAIPDIMSHSMMQPATGQPSSNTGSYYCWPAPPPPAVNPHTSSSRFPSHQRRGPSAGGYRISPQNPPDFSHPAQHLFRQPHNPVQPGKTVSETGYPVGASGSMKSAPSVASSSASSNWKERPHVGKYSLIRTIGKGNFAKVKLAQHVTTGMEVSVISISLVWWS